MNNENPYRAPSTEQSPPVIGWKAIPENVRKNILTALCLFSMAFLQLINIALNGVPSLPSKIFFFYTNGPAAAVFIGCFSLVHIWGWVGSVAGLRKWVWLLMLILAPTGYLLYLLYSKQMLA